MGQDSKDDHDGRHLEEGRADRQDQNFAFRLCVHGLRQRAEALALPWQIYGLDFAIGFPNQVFNDSWVVGFWRAGHGRQTVELGRRACALA